ncbi:MAG: efflux RND transporter permease subunit [Candidatus Hydrogenedentota bacterium]|nr:MAG: efflux RND transporter permease subunit [Candidatus Hydrogenedentota bacterium]
MTRNEQETEADKGASLSKGPISWMARNAVAANLLMLIFLVGGTYFAFRTTQEVFPEFDLDIVTITVPYPGATPRDVENGILLAIEEAVRGLDGIKRVTANAYEGAGRVIVELELGTNRNKALQDIKNAVDRITSFPEEAERPIVSLASNKRQVLSLILYGEMDRQALRAWGEHVREELLQSPGITQVEFDGARAREIHVDVPRERLRAYGLTLGQIADVLRRTALELPAGSVKTQQGEILLRTDERRDYAREFADIPVVTKPDGTIVRLAEIARIEDGFAETDEETLFFGKPAFKIDVFRVGDERPTEISRIVREYVKEHERLLPPGAGYAIWNDRSEILAQRTQLLLRNARLGLLLVLLLLGAFLRIRLAFWVTMGIPVSILGAFLAAPILGVTINMISLFAFIITIGIVVDDAIVVGENIYEMRQRGMNSMEAAIVGARMIAVPVVFSVLTNIVAFAPMLFVSGMMGKFFRVIPFIVIPVFSISLFESLFILPAHLSHLPPPRTHGIIGRLNRVQGRVAAGLERFIAARYGPALDLALRNRYTTIALSVFILLVVLGVVAGGHIRFSFLPKIESDAITATAVLPEGTPIEETRRIQRKLLHAAEKVLARHGGKKITRGILSQVGGTLAGFGPLAARGTSATNVTGVRVFLVSSEDRAVHTSQITREWEEEVGELTGLESLSFEYNIGPGSGKPIDVELAHQNRALLERAAKAVAAALENFRGVRDIDDGFESGKRQFNLELTPVGRALGLSTRELANQVRHSFYGAEAFRQQRGRDEVRVLVRLPRSQRRSVRDVESLIIRTPAGTEIPLSEAATVERTRGFTSIKRVDGRRVIDVTADIVPGVGNAAEILAALKKDVLPSLLPDYPGLQYRFSGEERHNQEALGSLFEGFLLALFAIYALLAVPFKSYFQPLIIMTSIPFGIIGATLGHILMGYEISIMSLFGIVALSGVVVNDSLVMIDTINQLRREGVSAAEAAAAAPRRRFRPIILTSLTTFFGLAPMIFERSVQARFLIPMAISLGYGILFATLIVLFLVPCLYLALNDLRNLTLSLLQD